MPESNATEVHLVKIPLRVDRLMQAARSRGIPARDLDDGYLAHSVLTELWQQRSPLPFVLKGRQRTIDVWGYCGVDAQTLIAHANDFGDPALLQTIDGIGSIASKRMPVFPTGRAVGFTARVCPVVRLSKSTNGHRPGAEVDAFLARTFAEPENRAIRREDVYSEWFGRQFADVARVGARVTTVRVAGMSRTRLVRRTQGAERHARSLERPDVYVEGELVVENGETFLGCLARGIGRHRAFGFGALLIIAPDSIRRAS